MSRRTTSPIPLDRRPPLVAAIDLVAVLVFVLIGRRSHAEHESVLGVLTTYWPFASGLVAGWLVTLRVRAKTAPWPTGVVLVVCTVAIGMLLRVASRQGVQLSFVIVATIALAILLLGWRAVARLVARRRRA